ncbi:hypothetical protein ACFQX6_08745 [Streptosporangium lutulentum]
MNHVLRGLAANPALPLEMVDWLITTADEDIAAALAEREDLTHAQAAALASRIEQSVARLVERGLLLADDVDPAAQPLAALALLAVGAGRPAWARLLAADPIVEHREELAACPGLPPEARRASQPTQTYGSSRSSRCGRRRTWPPGWQSIRMPRSAARWRATRRPRRRCWPR